MRDRKDRTRGLQVLLGKEKTKTDTPASPCSRECSESSGKLAGGEGRAGCMELGLPLPSWTYL